MTASERRWKWVKKESQPAELNKLLEQLSGNKKKKKETAADGEEDDENKVKEEGVEKEDFMTEIKRDYLSMDFTIYPTCQEVLVALKEERMKAKYSAEYHTLVLQKILDEMPCVESHEITMKVETIILLVSTFFQTARGSGFLTRDQWVTVHDRVRELLKLSQTPAFIIALKEAHLPDAPVPEKEEESDQEEQLAQMMEEQNKFAVERSVFPSLSTFLERMDENLWKSYQKLHASSSSIDYLQRINDENKLLFLIDETMVFINQFDLEAFRGRISLIKLQYIYYKNDSIYAKIKKRMEAKGGSDVAERLSGIYTVEDSMVEIEKIVQLVQSVGQPKMRVKATLLQVYHLALHNKVIQAKDLIKKTHIGEIVHQSQNVDNQILYNRALAQIGMAFFRLGRIEESHDVLVEIFQNPRFRELLAQGFNRHYEKTQEQE